MKALIWKEFRLCWPILLTGAVLLVAPYMLPFMVMDWNELLVHRSNYFAGSASASLGLSSLLTTALLGGYAIACERADRSAEFLAYQPISRGKILASKLVWPIVATAVVWGINLLTIFCCRNFLGRVDPDTSLLLGSFFVIGLLCFSVSWLVSALQSSPTFAVGSGVMAPVAIGLCFAIADWLTDEKSVGEGHLGLYKGYLVACMAVAVGSLIYGCGYYVRRVEP